MIPIVGVSLEEALLGLGGDEDAELHDKEVSLTTSQITSSQTAVFEYDPEDEDPQGTPPGPWDGYSLFTIDLSGVKDDIEGMQARISDLEDELEDAQEQLAEMEECCDEVVDVIHEYDPPYDPHPDPPDPTNPTIPEKIQEIIDEESGYEFPDDVPLEDITKITGADPIGSPNTDNQIKVFCEAKDDNQNVYTGTRIDATAATGNLYAYIRVQVVDNYGNILYNARYPNYNWWIGYSDSGYIQLNSYYIYNTDRLHVDYQTYSTQRTADFQSSYFADFQPPYKVKNS